MTYGLGAGPESERFVSSVSTSPKPKYTVKKRKRQDLSPRLVIEKRERTEGETSDGIDSKKQL